MDSNVLLDNHVSVCQSLKSMFLLITMGCVVFRVHVWSSLKRLPLPPSGCDSSSIQVRRAGWAAVLLVIASEMNYLAESETEGGEEIVIELPSPSLSCLKLLHLQCRKPFSACT